MKKRRSSKGLMLNEDPRETIKALCRLSNSVIDWELYKSTYEDLIGREKPISKQHADTHFYTLSIYGLIAPSQSARKGKYSITTVGRMLCKSLAKGSMEEYKRILANVLLNNSEKGHFFRSFIAFVKSSDKVTYDDILRFVENKLLKEKTTRIGIVARTLRAWSKDAGLIETDKERKLIWSIKEAKKKSRPSLKEFWTILLDKYLFLRESEIFGIENIFVDILELRTLVCIDRPWSNEEFNQYLVKLLDSEYGEKIRLYGAPTSVFSNRENFGYKGRVYAYIRMEV